MRQQAAAFSDQCWAWWGRVRLAKPSHGRHDSAQDFQSPALTIRRIRYSRSGDVEFLTGFGGTDDVRGVVAQLAGADRFPRDRNAMYSWVGFLGSRASGGTRTRSSAR